MKLRYIGVLACLFGAVIVPSCASTSSQVRESGSGSSDVLSRSKLIDAEKQVNDCLVVKKVTVGNLQFDLVAVYPDQLLRYLPVGQTRSNADYADVYADLLAKNNAKNREVQEQLGGKEPAGDAARLLECIQTRGAALDALLRHYNALDKRKVSENDAVGGESVDPVNPDASADA